MYTVLYNILYLFLFFIIYSFIGWFIEVAAVFFNDRKFVNRGFLMGPYCPIYGLGALIMLLIISKYENDPISLFFMFALYASILEYFTSFLMEKLFNARWWDYSHMKFNLNGRICLTNAILFGIMGVIFGYFLNPFIISLLDSIPVNILYIVSPTVIIIFIVDLSITFNVVSRLRKNIVLLNKDMTEDIKKQIVKFVENNHMFKAFPLLKQKIDKLSGK